MTPPGRDALEQVTAVWGPLLSTATGPDAWRTTLRPPPGEGVGAAPPAGAEPPDLASELELRERLGAGGMGVVHLARQRSLGRDVAVKTLHPDAPASPARLGAFLDEARVTARLEHPNVVPVHALGRGARGEVLLAMKRLEGRPWSDLLRDDPPGRDPAALARHVEVLARVVDAVAFAHARGVLHRDLKPQNVMVGEWGQVHVVDWGLACDLGPDGAARPAVAGGTPAYLSPEAAGGEEPLTRASDVYLLGAVLCELLVGAPPHPGASAANVLVAALENRVVPLAAPFPAAAPLADLAARCLATRPAERFASAAELRAALEAYRTGETRAREAGALLVRARERLAALPAELPAGPAAAACYPALFEVDGLVQAALERWPDSPTGAELRRELGARLVECALAAGDVGLADSLLARARALGAATDALAAAVERRRHEGDPATIVAFAEARRRVRRVAGLLLLALGYAGVVVPALFASHPEALDEEQRLAVELALLAGLPGVLLHLPLWLAGRAMTPRAAGPYRAAVLLSVAATVALVAAWVRALAVTRGTGVWWLGVILAVPPALHASLLAGLLDARLRRLFAP